MNKLMHEGRFHILFRKSRNLKSLVNQCGSESASQRAHEHRKHLLLRHSVHSHISFSWRKVSTASCWLLTASKDRVPMDEQCFIHISGDGTWAFIHPFYCGTDSNEVLGGHKFFTVVLSTGGIDGPRSYIQKLSHQPSCSAPSS